MIHPVDMLLNKTHQLFIEPNLFIELNIVLIFIKEKQTEIL